MESDNNSVSADEGMDRETKAMFSKIDDWKSRGYDVTRLESLRDDPQELKSVFFDYLNDLHTLESVEEELDSMDVGDNTTFADVIRNKLRNPDMVEDARYELEELKQKIARAKLGGGLGRSTESISSAMRKGFDSDSGGDTLLDELRKIRGEEGDKIRRDETDRIRQEEIERIRKTERERLVKEEATRLKREAREREMFQQKVKKTLQDAQNSKKKFKKCPACKKKIEIKSEKRPLRVKCQCGKEYTLRGDSESAFRRCRCGNVIGIPSNVRPLKISCKKCGHSYLLKEKSDKESKSKPSRKIKLTPSREDDIQMVPAPRQPSGKISVVSRKKEMENMKRSQVDVLSKIGGKQTPNIRESQLDSVNYAREPTPGQPAQAPPPGELPGEENGVRHCPNCRHSIGENFNVCGYCGYVVDKPPTTDPFSPQVPEVPPQSMVPEPAIPGTPEVKSPGFPGMEPAQVGTKYSMPDNMMRGQQPAQQGFQDSPPFTGPEELAPLPEAHGPGESSRESPGGASTKFCPQCGEKMAPGSKFCGGCGFTFP